MGTVSKKFGFIRATLAMWTGNLFAGRAGVVTDSTPGPVERWGWYDGSTWRFSARSGASETFDTLTLGGATRPGWGAGYTKVHHIGGTAVVAENNFGFGSYQRLSLNWYSDGTNARAIESRTSTAYPCFLAITDKAAIDFQTSTTSPTAGGIISDMTSKWSVSRAGAQSLAGGCGFFGVAAPSSRPSVTGSRGGNAALASLLTALNACGLITDSTTA